MDVTIETRALTKRYGGTVAVEGNEVVAESTAPRASTAAVG